jgi:hypothetical protein
MSKALTGQAMVAELQGVGSRAASETAKSRQAEINDADRDICVGSMGEIFRWITLFNFGNGVAPPSIEFYKPEKAGKDRAETYQTAANMGARPSRSAMLEELGIPQAESDDDALLPVQPPAQPVVKPAPAVPTAAAFSAWRELPAFKFARDAGMTDEEAQQLATEAADQTIEDRMSATRLRARSWPSSATRCRSWSARWMTKRCARCWTVRSAFRSCEVRPHGPTEHRAAAGFSAAPTRRKCPHEEEQFSRPGPRRPRVHRHRRRHGARASRAAHQQRQ